MPAPSPVVLSVLRSDLLPLRILIVHPASIPDTCQDLMPAGQSRHMGTRSGMAAVNIEARFTSMFERHYNEVLAYGARRSTRSDADDIAAEVFAVAWRRIEEID